jgi:DNA-binding NtrC family response regulator
VEDEEIVRGLAREVLEMNGYVVLEAATPNDAIAVCKRHSGRIDMLLTDVVMPQMSGRALSEQLLKLRPGLGVMFMSGYTSDAIVDHSVLNEGVKFIQKPFSPESLAHAVRSVLEESN